MPIKKSLILPYPGLSAIMYENLLSVTLKSIVIITVLIKKRQQLIHIENSKITDIFDIYEEKGHVMKTAHVNTSNI